ncbi:MAG: hypothetical protein IT286_05050, partial [Proteobacteria bacterium]|nr:hypothetical protein [Pseudomonadota bacterium]
MIFQCLGITGAILLFYGMVAFAITQALTWQNKLLLIAGLVMMIVFLIEAVRKSWLKDLFKKRKTQHGMAAIIYSAIVAFILIVVNIGSHDFNKQFDYTVEKINTISEQTEKVVASINEPMKITTFFENQGEQANIKLGLKSLLEKY